MLQPPERAGSPEHEIVGISRHYAWWSRPSGRAETVLWAAYALMCVLLVGYLAFLIVRGPGQSSQLLDGWLVDGFEMVAAALCIARGLTRRSGRAVALTLGFGLIMWPIGAHHSVVTRVLPPFEHVNLQTAIDAWSARAGRTVEVRGIALPPHYGGLTLQQLVAGEALPPLRLTAPALADLPNGPKTTLGCLRLALLLVTDQHGRYVVMIQAPNEHDPSLQIEVAGLPVELAQRLLAELDRLRAELNVYRGHLLDVSLNPMGGVILTFAGPPGIGRDDVVLPATVLGRVERHALGVARHREALLAAGQHLIRRSVLELLHDDPALTAVTGAQLARALDDLLDAAQAVTRTLHGVGVDPADLPAGGALSPGPGRGLMAFNRRRMPRHYGQYGG